MVQHVHRWKTAPEVNRALNGPNEPGPCQHAGLATIHPELTESVIEKYVPARHDTSHEVAGALLHAAEPHQLYASQTDGEQWPAPHVLKVAQLPVHFALADGGPADSNPLLPNTRCCGRIIHPHSSISGLPPSRLLSSLSHFVCLAHPLSGYLRIFVISPLSLYVRPVLALDSCTFMIGP